MKKIPRESYIRRLIESQDNGLVKIITGIRRCGKSYLLFNLFHDYLNQTGIDDEHIIEFSMDSLDNEQFNAPHTMLAAVRARIKDRKKYYIFLDEIQMMPGFESLLNTLLHTRNVEVYVTGSNSHFLSKDIVTEFRGRGEEIRMHPLCFREFSLAYAAPDDECWEDYFNYGGMPLVLSYSSPERKMNYLEQLFRQVYEADIKERHHVRNTAEFDELLDVLASAVGSLTNPKKLADTFQSLKGKIISPKTLRSYIDYMEDSFMLNRALRYDVKGKKYINTPLKYYFEDVGLRNIRLGFRQQEENHIMENIIYNELLVRGYSVDVGMVEIKKQDKDGKWVRIQLEVDFIASLGSKKYYVQSALSIPDREKEIQESRPLTNINDSFKKVIIVKDHIMPRRNEEGILTIGLFDFLLKEDSLDL